MIIFCEECGEKYVLEDQDFKDSAMVFTCRVCKDIIRVPVPESRRMPGEKVKEKEEKKQ